MIRSGLRGEFYLDAKDSTEAETGLQARERDILTPLPLASSAALPATLEPRGLCPVLGQEFSTWQISACEEVGLSVTLICLVFSPL